LDALAWAEWPQGAGRADETPLGSASVRQRHPVSSDRPAALVADSGRFAGCEVPGAHEGRHEARELAATTKDEGWMERWHDWSPLGRKFVILVHRDPEPSSARQGPDSGTPEGDDDGSGVCLD
jgi:hypothetical protein